ncbi:DUF4291 family protein [Streptomyces sp. NPDC048504]|uniref:DUF4291 family protein n=1 Tax=Streptomyces sp. NPDC048504 TaxID=3365559 RepID=UPI0037137E98
MEEPQRGIRAVHSESTITVYQAYPPEIGVPAAREGRFPAAWKRERMTWVIKPRWQTFPWQVTGYVRDTPSPVGRRAYRSRGREGRRNRDRSLRRPSR